MYSLTEEERGFYCDLEFFRLMKIVMVADSESYNFLRNEENMLTWRAEFLKNNGLMVERYKSFWN